jgi:tagatose-6-phosphate ketose/aldose isomerase
MLRTLLADQSWIEALSKVEPKVAELFSRSPEEQLKAGYFHTVREIWQQPATWEKTAGQMVSCENVLREDIGGIRTLVLTGSGSSEFAGDCVGLVLQRELDVVAKVIGGGTLLTYGESALPGGRPALAVSLARSGDSPETVGAISRCLQDDPSVRHLVLTCNRQGRVAEAFRENRSVRLIALDDATNDRSLVMTSSFSNLVLAARSLSLLENTGRYLTICEKLSSIAEALLRMYVGTIAGVARSGFQRAVYLGSGTRLGAARESALKMLEMTAGAVATLRDSYLGFRHGPMSFAHPDTLIVCFLSSDPLLRAYECDLLQELNQKNLGLLKVIVGENVPADMAREEDVIIDCPGLKDVGDDETPVIHVMVGQLLAFFRCMEEGLRPDSPSEDGVINRVVQSFKIHLPSGGDGKSRGKTGD